MKNVHAVMRSMLDSELYEYGFADLRGLLAGRYASYAYGISVVRCLDATIIDAIEEGPTRGYLELYHAVNHELNDVVARIAKALEALNMAAQPVPATVYDEQLDEHLRATLTYPLSHKMVATRAGLGWIGKTDLLVTFRFGPRVRLASVLVRTPLEAAIPVEESHCGTCNVCVERCPAGAGTGQPWSKEIHRDVFFDAHRCRDYCRKTSLQRLNERISICGRCVSVCPMGQG